MKSSQPSMRRLLSYRGEISSPRLPSSGYCVRALGICEGGNGQLSHDEVICRLMAYSRSSALVLMPRVSIMRYLWKATVPGLRSRTPATSFIDMPSASSCRISLWRLVMRFSSALDFPWLIRKVTVSLAISGDR